VIGVGADRMVTLTHEAQLKRFSDELVTIRELCDGEEVTEENISALYQVAFDRQFWLGNYGLSDLQDLLEDPGIVKILKTFKPLGIYFSIQHLGEKKKF
jgi:meiosis arrest female protein 1